MTAHPRYRGEGRTSATDMPLTSTCSQRDRLWQAKIDRKQQVALLRLPAQPRIPLCWVQLPTGAKCRSQFLVRGAKGMEQGGHSIAIRQLFER